MTPPPPLPSSSPFGTALGYGFGGFVSASGPAGWRWMFVLEALPMIPLILLVFFMPYNKPRRLLLAEERAARAASGGAATPDGTLSPSSSAKLLARPDGEAGEGEDADRDRLLGGGGGGGARQRRRGGRLPLLCRRRRLFGARGAARRRRLSPLR